jgi:hypothetical protein
LVEVCAKGRFRVEAHANAEEGRMRFYVRSAALIALPLYMSGCALVSGRCTYETRYVLAEGSIMDGPMVVANGSLQAGGMRGSDNHRHLGWTITTSSLTGHITALRLVDSTDPATTLLSLPIAYHPSSPGTLLGELRQNADETSPALGGIFEIVRSNRAVLDITTDLADRAQVTLPLTVVQTEDWSRPFCS